MLLQLRLPTSVSSQRVQAAKPKESSLETRPLKLALSITRNDRKEHGNTDDCN